MAKKLLEGKNTIVTGSARGIGHKTVEVFAANGANVWACARKQTPEFDAYCSELSSKYLKFPTCDIRDFIGNIFHVNI